MSGCTMCSHSGISEKLVKLKADLVSIRQQDVKLMKQLISINESIQRMSLTNRGTVSKPVTRTFVTCQNGQKGCIGVNIIPADQIECLDTPLIRQQSVPTYYKTNLKEDQLSSAESSISSSLDDCSSITSIGDFEHLCSSPLLSVKHPKQLRHKSDNFQTSSEDSVFDIDDRDYEDILIKNIQIWKDGHSVDNDSVFD